LGSRIAGAPRRSGTNRRAAIARHRIAAETRKILGQDRADEGRHRVARLADGEIDRGLARLDAGEELGQADESRATRRALRTASFGAIALGHG
jgi:hypothetical protein